MVFKQLSKQLSPGVGYIREFGFRIADYFPANWSVCWRFESTRGKLGIDVPKKKKSNGQILPTTQGVWNGSSKNVGLGKFWPNLQILEVFVMGFEVLFSGDFVSWSLNFFKKLSLEFWNWGLAASQSLEFTISIPLTQLNSKESTDLHNFWKMATLE